MVLRQLNDVDHRLPTLGEAAVDTVSRIEKLFARTPVIEISDDVKLRAAQRAIEKRAPFHRQRNGIDDAILIEVYADLVGAKATGTRFAFVTHNTKDFSHPNASNKLPHPDMAVCFSRTRSLYFITLGEALRRVQPTHFADLMIEQEWVEEPRRLAEIVDAIDELCTKVWCNRHQVTRQKIERGKIKIVEKEVFPVKNHLRRPIQRDVWEGALKSAAKVEKKYGLENLGPWDDFEWGCSAASSPRFGGFLAMSGTCWIREERGPIRSGQGMELRGTGGGIVTGQCLASILFGPTPFEDVRGFP
jgi:hypothetical protein